MKHWNTAEILLIVGLLGLVGCSSSDSVTVANNELSQSSSADVPVLISETFSGGWILDPTRSTAIDPWRNLSVDIVVKHDEVILERNWRGSREGGTFTDSSRFVVGGGWSHTELEQWPDNRHLGAYIAGDGTKSILGWAEDDGTTLVTEVKLIVSVQQGEQAIRIYSEYRLSLDGNRLDLIELRSTRPTPLHYVFRREEN